MDAERILGSKLRQAVRDGNMREVLETLSLHDKTLALLIAAESGWCEVVIYLIDDGTGVQYAENRQGNLLHLLLYSDTHLFGTHDYRLVQCIAKLVDSGVDANQLNEDKDTAMSIAARKQLHEVVIYLIEHGGDVHYVDGRENNLLHLILMNDYRGSIHYSANGRLHCVVKLIDAGVDANQLNVDEDTPIVMAAKRGLYEVVIYLLEHGVNLHYVESRQNNLIHILLDSSNIFYLNKYMGRRDLLLKCVVKLVDDQVDEDLPAGGVDVEQVNGVLPVIIAARKGLYDVVKYLFKRGVDIHYADSSQNNLIHILLVHYDNDSLNCTDRRDFLQCVVTLVNAGVDVNQVNDSKVTPIFIAARQGLYEVVIYLLEHGVDVHYVDSFKCNILHCVLGYMNSYAESEEKYIQLANSVINMGVDINQPDYKGNTPLFYVGINCNGDHDPFDDLSPISLGEFFRIRMKLETEQDMHVRLKCKIINSLSELGCNVNHQNELGRTALMHHIKHQADICILKQLIPYSDLHLTDNNGNTAISYCVKYHMINATTIFQLLVDSGSDLMSRNNGVKFFQDILKCKRSGLFSNYMSLKMIVNGCTAEGENMLHLLAYVNYDYSVKKFSWLLNNELDINHRCSKTNTPTMIAAFLLNSKYLELLTRHPRLEINAQNNQGHTALHLCIIGFTMFLDGLNKRHIYDCRGYCEHIYLIYMACVDTLLGVDGIDVNIPDNGGRTTLMMAAMKNDRPLTRKLLHAGAKVTMLDYSRRSALQYLDIYHSLFDLTCFKLLLCNGNTGLLNLPCIDGNTIIQTALCFPRLWNSCQTICFIRYLVAENCCLQILVTSSVKSNYNQIYQMMELSLQERDKLRKLLYLSGAQGEQIMISLNFDQEDKAYDEKDPIRSRSREEFINFCCNVSLKSLCRRIIRQKLGLGITEKVKHLELSHLVNSFLLLNDVLHPQDYNVDHINDCCNDFDYDNDYGDYGIDKVRDGDYSQYNYQNITLNTDHELRQDYIRMNRLPSGGYVYDYLSFYDYKYDDHDCDASI